MSCNRTLNWQKLKVRGLDWQIWKLEDWNEKKVKIRELVLHFYHKSNINSGFKWNNVNSKFVINLIMSTWDHLCYTSAPHLIASIVKSTKNIAKTEQYRSKSMFVKIMKLWLKNTLPLCKSILEWIKSKQNCHIYTYPEKERKETWPPPVQTWKTLQTHIQWIRQIKNYKIIRARYCNIWTF